MFSIELGMKVKNIDTTGRPTDEWCSFEHLEYIKEV